LSIEPAVQARLQAAIGDRLARDRIAAQTATE
jgi:hypothetical protein